MKKFLASVAASAILVFGFGSPSHAASNSSMTKCTNLELNIEKDFKNGVVNPPLWPNPDKTGGNWFWYQYYLDNLTATAYNGNTVAGTSANFNGDWNLTPDWTEDLAGHTVVARIYKLAGTYDSGSETRDAANDTDTICAITMIYAGEKKVTPTPADTTTPTPTIGNPDTITEGTDVALKLNLDLNAKLTSGSTSLSGTGLMANSEYKLILQSDPVTLFTGKSDPSGNFDTKFDFGSVTCPAAGVHTLTLAGIKPDGTQTKAVAKMLLDSGCKATAIVQGGLVKNLTFGGLLFNIHSPKLTSKSIANLKAIAPLLKDAKKVTLVGYTQTNYKSKSTIPGSKRLAKKRAIAVSKYLKKLGVTANITVVGNGPVDPVNLKKQYLNRRVEVSVGYTS